MPWTPQQFASRHNHHLSGADARKAAGIANAILRRTGDEGLAIRTANARAEGHDTGGIVGYDGGTPPMGQSLATQTPFAQNQLQQFGQLTPEKLQELAVRLPPGSPQGNIVRRVLAMKHMAPQTAAPQPQGTGIVAPSSPYERGGGIARREMGGPMGGMSLGLADPWWARREASEDAGMATGYLHGPTLGRADHVTTAAPGGSYVIPADVVAGLGEGNSLAGANVIERMLGSGPYGTRLPRMGHGSGPPRAPRPAPLEAQRTGGVSRGTVGEPVPVKLSHGEYTLSPEQVMRIGRAHFGNALPARRVMSLTHKMLDKWVRLKRKQQIKKLQSLPGPTR